MNGAESLVHTLLDGGVDVCFANPGTSEMHFVAALDHIPGMRCVLGLFEGVVSGAADGYGRMTGKPAATLLHLGPGLANASANLHNAKKARSPIVNVVGDHATYHVRYDAPLTSDVRGVARPFSHWVGGAAEARGIAEAGAQAIAAARAHPGQIATLILPADTAWGEADGPAAVPAIAEPEPIDPDALKAAVAALEDGGSAALLYIGGKTLRKEGLALAAAIAAKTGATVMAPTSNGRAERGAGIAAVERVPYVVELALDRLKGFRRAVLVEAKEPVGFFAYPGLPSRILPGETRPDLLAGPEQDGTAALRVLADAVGARVQDAPMPVLAYPDAPDGGALTAQALAQALAAHLPEGAIVVDESVSNGVHFWPMTATCAPHDWLQVTGGSIGIGLPLAAGCAVACPERRVIVLQADGSAMYTPQALWTHAREGLNVTTIILDNSAYAILAGEMTKVGANPGARARSMLTLDEPRLDWLSLAQGMGVPAARATDAASLSKALARSLTMPGPSLIDAVLA
ncbi:acetolactate synthase large subunit [Marinivivus vitaminiproducens]|uniref:acetolactate synthase large subunit n=1 Tax=Marinivivus vitaminiproducens TaxID=3035935 RepID=UPI0027A94D70|nr:acetolactate synthase large subunit [Geminicoccaceae bacterium SCSIO 64248]